MFHPRQVLTLSVRGALCATAILFAGLVGAAPAAALTRAAPVLTGSITDSNPTSCNTSSTCLLSGTVAVAVSGHFAYTTSYYAGRLTVIDLSNPAHPTIAGESGVDSRLFGGSNVNIIGNYAYVASKNLNASTSNNDNGQGNSLVILNIGPGHQTSPVVAGAIQGGNGQAAPLRGQLFGAYGVTAAGSYAYVAAQGVIQNSGQPQSPDTGTGQFDVIHVGSLSSPSSPALTGFLNNNGLPSNETNALDHIDSVAVSGDYAYVTAWQSACLTALSIANPASPSYAGRTCTTQDLDLPNDVIVRGAYAYVVEQNAITGRAQLSIFSLSNPVSPQNVGVVTLPALYNAYRLRVVGNFAYVAAVGTGLAGNGGAVSAVDIANPANPQVVASVSTSQTNRASGLDVATVNGQAYVVSSSPAQPGDNAGPYPPFPDTGNAGSISTGTIAMTQLDPSPIAVAIGSTPSATSHSPTATFTFTTSDQVASDWCSLDGAAPTPCTSDGSDTLSGLRSGHHTFTVQAFDASGNVARASHSWTVALSPRVVKAPKINGAAVEGLRISTRGGTWTGSPRLSYRWERCAKRCRAIRGATRSRYRLKAADVGHRVKVTVTATNGAGRMSASSPVLTVSAAAYGGTAKLVGVGQSTQRIEFALGATAGAPGLKTIAVSQPRGVTSSGVSGVIVESKHGRPLRESASLNGGTLTIKLHRPARLVIVIVSSPAIHAARMPRSHRLSVAATNSAHTTARLSLKLKSS